MLSRTRLTIMLLAAAATGCAGNFQSTGGDRIGLANYDSVIVDEVTVAETVPFKIMAGYLEANLKLELLESDRWLKAGDQDDVETLLRKSGRDNPWDRACVYTEKKRRAEKEQWEALSLKPPGTRPLTLKAEITKVVFPGLFEMRVLGATCYAYCRVELFDGGNKLGEATIFSAPEFPRLAVYTAGIAGVLSNIIRHKVYGEEDQIMLAENIAWETVKALSRARAFGPYEDPAKKDTSPEHDTPDAKKPGGGTDTAGT